MKKQSILQAIGFIMVLLAILVILLNGFIAKKLMVLIETKISHDGQIDFGLTGLRMYFISFSTFLALTGLFFLTLGKPIFSKIKYYLTHDNSGDLLNSGFSEKRYYQLLFIAFALASFFFLAELLAFIPFFGNLQGEDKFMEIFATSCIFVSIVLLIISITKINSLKASRIELKVTKLILFLLILGLTFFLLEEISYGQRIFGWESGNAFEGNVQEETNLHNFIGFIALDLLHTLFGILFSLFFILIWLMDFYKKLPDKISNSFYFKLLFPHSFLFLLTFLLLNSAVLFDKDELFEEIFSLFILFYAAHLFFVLRRSKIIKGYN